MRCIIMAFLLLTFYWAAGQQCRFEQSGGMESATYAEAVDWYLQLAKQHPAVQVKTMRLTDAGYPLHLVLVSSGKDFSVTNWRKQGKAVILINNGIHPGEPDGIDASMLLTRDIVKGKITLPPNVILGIIPVYNIGGCFNRGTTSRANQNGPLEYGFRGNSQNLDLNRDFTKCDSREARSFAQIFHYLQPDILIDNHVSDGADYQHTMTMLTTQYDKLSPTLGPWLRDVFEPQLYAGMKEKKWDMCPYVNFETTDFGKGMEQFYDPPRYSSGYAALFGTIGFVPETHMLKPFADRVRSTYAFMQTVIEKTSINTKALKAARANAVTAMQAQQQFALNWVADTLAHTNIRFSGYEQAFTTSAVTGKQRMYYDHNKPYTKDIAYYNQYKPGKKVSRPAAYIIPKGWHTVIELLQLNGVQIQTLTKDSSINVEAYKIVDYKSFPRPYEKHHKNYGVQVSAAQQTIRFAKGDCIIYTNQPACRYLIEMLEPTGDDSFFAWNFFDAVLQQKEGYSDYRWEEVAEKILKNNPALQQELEEKKKADAKFAADASAQLDFVYKHSTYYEPGHNRYPVYRLL